jgi:hypothetical protein
VNPVSSANLIAATLNLQLVNSVLRAIRVADRAAIREDVVLTEPCRDRFCCGVWWRHPCYLPRRVIHPTPRYLPRPVLHPTPRVEEPCCPPPCCPSAKVPHLTPGPQPPWKTMPWQEPVRPASVIKMIVRAPDTQSKGTLVDLFL